MARALTWRLSSFETQAIQFKVLAQPALVIADSLQIQQVIINLTRNAIDALAALPHQERIITVSIRERSSGMVEFSVHNPGPVISSEILPHIFEPFFTTKDDGLGMGLAICSRVVESHGGTIHAKSTSAAGTKITCRLPAIAEESVDEA
jgi:signal transduction histidine kinase